jgi:crossover junction endodeoxyribonuclease RuvC
MIILGIDPGTASTGYGIIKKVQKSKREIKFRCLEYGLIKTVPTFPTAKRLQKINNELSKLIKKYKPAVLAMENVYFFKNLKTFIPVSQAEGVILLTAAKNNTPVFELTPLQAKMAITGYGWAEKFQVQKKVKTLLHLKEIPKPDDAADALAIALAFGLPKRKETSKKT